MFDDLTFTTSSYIKDPAGQRARIVSRAMSTWSEFLSLPFGDTIFLDDHSPGHNATRLLQNCELENSFKRIEYETTTHPAQSNFGIVAAFNLADTPFIMRLDDDVHVTGNKSECSAFLARALNILREDQSILGMNLISMIPGKHGDDWMPGEGYARDADFTHPKKYFGTAASIIRRELLMRVPMTLIQSWGVDQPDNWERLVSQSPREFLTGGLVTPFASPLASYFFRATDERSDGEIGGYFIKAFIKKLIGKSPFSVRNSAK